ncbi:MAG: STAS domain-containing protein [Planctomycetes bacterium]|nr:STAS domain-containing protein [Planctomycetota bacterium]
MARTGSIFDVQRVADAYVLRFSHEDVGDPDALRAVRHEVGRLIDDREPLKVVLDLEKTAFLSSESVDLIIAIRNAIPLRGGRLHLARVSRGTYDALSELGLCGVIRIFGTIEDANEGFD